jgi:hypothetical protein
MSTTNTVMIVGDIHGQIHAYNNFINSLPESQMTIQLGDMGVGFSGVELPSMSNLHTWFRGNHDNPEKSKRHPNYRGDFGYDKTTGIFHIAGAWSIDYSMRVEGVSWWRDEELNWYDLANAFELYKKVKPRFVVSHECPTKASQTLIGGLVIGTDYATAKLECGKTRTAIVMQRMLDEHQPEQWVFGHYHMDHQFFVHGYDTRFVCVGGVMNRRETPHVYELEYKDGKI